jgi:hypothetical protein
MRHIAFWSCTHILELYSLKKQLFDLEVKCQGPTKVITVRYTPPYGHAPTYQISLTYLERQKCFGPDKKILFKKQLFDLEVKGQGPTKVITVRDTLPYGHALTYQISLTYLERQKKLWSVQASLRRSRRSGSGRTNQTKTI